MVVNNELHSFTFGGITSSGIFSFNQDGDMVSFEALRDYDRKEGVTLENWLILNDSPSQL